MDKNHNRISTPVVFIIFNRPDTTEMVFEAIRSAAPSQLFVIADGPRAHKAGEKELCKKTRQIIDKVDWDCELHVNFSEVNLGCKKRISSGLDWVFDQVDEAIILEDDCLPSPDFFRFCEELLETYRDDQRVMMISGDNFLPEEMNRAESYYYSRYTNIWGWATWKRAWKLCDLHMSNWPELRDRNWLSGLLQDEGLVNYWFDAFDKTYQGKIDSWAYPWLFTNWIQSGLTVIPAVNLVSNIGFKRNDATHTRGIHKHANLTVGILHFPLMHPKYMIRDSEADRLVEIEHYNIQLKESGKVLVGYYKERWLELKHHKQTILAPLVLQNLTRFIIFGTKLVGQGLKREIEDLGLQLVAYIENGAADGRLLEGIPVYSTDWILSNQEYFDAIIISVEGEHDREIRNQIKEQLNCSSKQVVSWKDLIHLAYEMRNQDE